MRKSAWGPWPAHGALQKCSETEYKSKPQLWAALGVLTPITGGAVHEISTQRLPAADTHSGPQTLDQKRRSQLERLIKPKKLPPSYKPDTTKLTVRDRQTVEQILRDARQAEPSNAHSMLIPWIARYPAGVCRKVHAAAFALAADDLSEASRLLREASDSRPLDTASRINLAYTFLHQSDYLGVVKALEGGENYATVETTDYWLALALARAISGQGDPGIAAARAIALATSEVSRKTVAAALNECGITPGSSVQAENPAMAAAREAQVHIERNDLAGAAECLNQVCGDHFERVGEIGTRVFDLQFERLPENKNGMRTPTGPTLYSAVKAYEVDFKSSPSHRGFHTYEMSARPHHQSGRCPRPRGGEA